MLKKYSTYYIIGVGWLLLLAACNEQVAVTPPPIEQPRVQEIIVPTESAKETAVTPENQPDAEPIATATLTTNTETTGTTFATACLDNLEPTARNSEGPYYKSGAPERTSLIEPGMSGTKLVVTGQVLTSACQPVAGALLDFWQADNQGEYDNAGYILRGQQFADNQGRYHLETIMPARYPGRPPHIHVKINAPGEAVVTTQIYFEGQPGNESDSIIQPSLMVPLSDAGDGSLTAEFNVVLVSEQVVAVEPAQPILQEYPVPPGSRPHDVAPAPDGTVWYTAQGSGALGRLNPVNGETHHIPLGPGSAPHGVIVGPDGAAWVTDSGLNAIVRVDPASEAVQSFPLPEGSGYANLNTATFDQNGVLWFTGQSGIYGRLNPATGQIEVFAAERGRGPYGIATTPSGNVYYASLAGSHVARIDENSGIATLLEPPTAGQGARRVWADSQGNIWVSEWNSAQVARYNPATQDWQEWRLPGDNPLPYAVYVDEQDMVWLSDFGANALVRFSPADEAFELFLLPSTGANVRQILGRPGEVWGAESGSDKLVVIRTVQ